MTFATVMLMASNCNPQDAPEKDVWIGGTPPPIYEGYAGETTFVIIMQFITDWQTVSITWYTNNNGTNQTTPPIGIITGALHNVTGHDSHRQAYLTFSSTASAAAGTYYFRATIDGIQSNVRELVITAPTLVTDIYISTLGGLIGLGQTTTLTAWVDPFEATNKNITWSSLHPSIATINASTGVVTAVSAGTATIAVSATDGSGVIATRRVSVIGQGNGLQGNPYIIRTPVELDAIRHNPSAHYKLGNDVNLTAYLALGGEGHTKWGLNGWMPFGGDYQGATSDELFSGSFDGADYRIIGLWINRPQGFRVSLFGSCRNGTVIKNLGIEIANANGGVNGYSGVGGVAGSFQGDSITNCYVTGNVSGNIGNNVGGIAGSLSGGSITNCYTTGTITGGGSIGNGVGGVVGYIYDGSIANCYATGAVIGYSDVGGVVGNLYSSSMTNCYAIGGVIGSFGVGGVAGRISEGSSLSNCYAIGAVSGSNSVGGIVGQVWSNSGVSNCVALNPSVTATNLSVGRMMGDNNGILANNWARSDIQNGSGGLFSTTNVSLTGRDGANITPVDAEKTSSWWTTAPPNGPGWNLSGTADNPWKWDATLLRPVLYWQ